MTGRVNRRPSAVDYFLCAIGIGVVLSFAAMMGKALLNLIF